MTAEDLGNKQEVIEQAKFEYSPLVKVFNKEDKKEGLLKRLKNVEGKSKEQLKRLNIKEKDN